jgi:diguanylate cyclase (GGDEF)-like protein/PAS domain S-box-containing protein
MGILLLKPLMFISQKILLLFCLFILCINISHGASNQILVLHSGGETDPLTHEIQAGIETAFKDSDVSLHVSYLDNSYQLMNEQSLFAYADYLSDKFKTKHFDFVIVSGKNTLRLVQLYADRLFADAPIVYTGVKPEESTFRVFTHKISGIVESKNLINTARLSMQLFPTTNTIYIVADKNIDQHLTDKKIQLLSNQLKQKITVISDETEESLKEIVKALSNNAVLIFNSFSLDKDGLPVNQSSLLTSLLSVAKVPVFVVHKYNLVEGVLGGYVASGFLQGEAAANKVLQVLGGTSIQAFPAEINLNSELLIQPTELRHWGLDEDELPNGYKINNQKNQEIHMTFNVITLFSLVVLFVLLLLWQRYRYYKLNQSRSLIKNQCERIENIFNVSYDFIFILDLVGEIKQANRTALDFVGVSSEQVEGEFLWKSPWWQNNDVSKKKLKSALGQARVGKTARFECYLVNKNQESHAFDVFIQSVKGNGLKESNEVSSIIVEARDISEIKAIEEEAQKANKQSNLLLDESPSMLLMLNAQGLILSCNKFGSNLLGYNDGELIGRNLVTLYSKQLSIGDLKDYLMLCASSEEMVQTREISYCTKNGRKVWINERVRKIEGHDQYFLVCENITERYELSKELNYRASHDYLTGLKNRLFFENQLDKTLKYIENKRTPCCLMYLDMDKFKIINDTCGHHAGDEVLRQIATILTENVSLNALVARLGGDEFAIILPDTQLEQAVEAAQNIITAIGKHYFLWEGHNFTLGISIGLADITDFWRGGIHALSCVDSACYIAKQSGRNRIHIYEEDKQEELRREEVVWVNKVQDALRDESRFCLYAQLIKPVDGDEKYLHYEILTRMIDENGELAPPDKFIPVAESYNLADKIDMIIITKALNWLKNHPDHVSKLTMCSINLSGQSLGDPQFIDKLVDLLIRSSLPLEKLCFEITETVAIGNFSNASKLINTLKKLGCQLALDDFGTGLSSFGYLKRLHVDYLKIDGVFVKDMANDEQDFGIVKTIHELSHLFGKKTIAEYVESEEIIEKLKEIGVDFAQGYHLGRPLPIDMMALLSESLYGEESYGEQL